MTPHANAEAPARVALIIPALNEEAGLARMLDELPRQWFARVLVVDNGSTDGTAAVARARGAEVVAEPQRGYGRACLTGLASLDDVTEIVVFMDADGSDVPAEVPHVLGPLLRGEADLVIGSRAAGEAEAEALGQAQRWGNWLAVTLVRLLFGYRYSDLGPFRAIRRRALDELHMRDTGFGWTIEMQVKAVRRGLRVREVPVSYRRRLGQSKISGTWRGVIGAGSKILWTIARLRVSS